MSFIYDELLKDGFLKSKKRPKNKLKDKKSHEKILNKVLYRNYEIEDNEKFISNKLYLKEIKNDRIASLCDSDINDHITFLKNKYVVELNKYEYIDSSNIDNIKCGGFLRMVDFKDNIKWGGMIIKIENKEDVKNIKIQLRNTKNKLWYIKFINYFIFYKKNNGNSFRDIFISAAKLDIS
tara:strand:- start:617 stop:1156 length:540 start_codon:yes stop_codon:yes gene_type:complete